MAWLGLYPTNYRESKSRSSHGHACLLPGRRLLSHPAPRGRSQSTTHPCAAARIAPDCTTRMCQTYLKRSFRARIMTHISRREQAGCSHRFKSCVYLVAYYPWWGLNPHTTSLNRVHEPVMLHKPGTVSAQGLYLSILSSLSTSLASPSSPRIAQPKTSHPQIRLSLMIGLSPFPALPAGFSESGQKVLSPARRHIGAAGVGSV